MILGEVAAADEPLVALFDEQHAGEADQRLVVGEDADDVGAAADLAVDALERVCGAQLAPVLAREGVEAEQILLGVQQQLRDLGRDRLEALDHLSESLARLLAVSERYPDLKANQNFLALQSQLEGTENRIAVARRDYIEAVRQYNTELRTFPGLIWASTVYRSYKPMETFTVGEDVMRPPPVKF